MSSVSIPAFHISDKSKVEGEGTVFIASRVATPISGNFSLKILAQFDPGLHDYPIGGFTLKVDLSDGAIGAFKSTTVELINSYGKHNPTIVLTGQCKDSINPDAKGCRYWLIIANNKKRDARETADIVGFAIHDRNGARIAYGMGPVKSGDFEIDPK